MFHQMRRVNHRTEGSARINVAAKLALLGDEKFLIYDLLFLATRPGKNINVWMLE